MAAYIFNFISLAIAVAAVVVATWQVRAAARGAERSNAIPVLAEMSAEVRSTQFRESLTALLTTVPDPPPSGGFKDLPPECRDHAYRVCYFFDYLGLLSSKGIISKETIISWVGTWIMQVWIIMQPCIMAERDYRQATFSGDTPPGFLPNFENLVRIILQTGGREAAARIQQNVGVTPLSGEALDSLTEERKSILLPLPSSTSPLAS